MEKASFKFALIEKNLEKLVELLIHNEDFKKYIYYLDDDPLSQSDVKEDLFKTGNIIMSMFDTKTLDKNKVTVCINPSEGDLQNNPLSDLIITIDIIVPCVKWTLANQGRFRAFRIADEITKSIDQKHVMGIGEVNVFHFKTYKVSTNLSGLTLWVRIHSSTLKGVR